MSIDWEQLPDARAKKKDRANYKKSLRASASKTSQSSVISELPEGSLLGILVTIHKNRVEIVINHERCEGVFSPALLAQGITDFAVGDYVVCTPSPDGSLLVLGRTERTSFIARARSDRTRNKITRHVLAANVDVGVITVAVKDPALHTQFIDRYLVLLEDGDVKPVICVTKTDLVSEEPVSLDVYKEMGIPVIETSFKTRAGIEELKKVLFGKTSVFIGQSGVGKSSLIGLLAPHEDIATGEVNNRTGKGTHTTTGSNLYEWAENSFIIDTPGVRSLGMEVVRKEEIRLLFPEFAEFAAKCKYHDCLHVEEPRCAVREALKKTGMLGARRYDSYVRMMQE
ncbi:MAG: ribosome small subunit-dependent GTPase A [Patescibacteria group bacterium]